MTKDHSALSTQSFIMLPEQQQRILGYFIEEARDHLNTIEQGLMNLQSTLDDQEMVNEVFRAAHSIKGSAAMLGLNSIQHTAHRLEDCFKVLKEHPVQVDEKLESLFLGVSDTLKVLLEHLSGPFGLSEEAANTLMSETEPVFTWLYEHLDLLVQQRNSGVLNNSQITAEEPNSEDSVTSLTDLFLRTDMENLEEESESTSTELPVSVFTAENSPVTEQSIYHWDEFQTQVLQALREMLQLFKQRSTPESRHNLQQCCLQLVSLGQTWNLPHWCELCQGAANAIANPENTYLGLAKIVITEIKQAQELVLQYRENEIAISQQLTALLNLPELELLESQDLFVDQPTSVADTENFASEPLQPTDSITSLTELSEQLQPSQNISAATENTIPEIAATTNFFWDDEEDTPISDISQNGPEVGLSELNSLADLFEGETEELDESWQQEEIVDIRATSELGIDVSDTDIEDFDSDLADFLFLDEGKSDHDLHISITTKEELNQLFGKNFSEAEQQNQPTSAEISSELETSSAEINPNDLMGDLLTSTPNENELISTGESTQLEPISNNQESSFDELFSDPDNAGVEDSLQHEVADNQRSIIQPESVSLDALFDDFDHIPQLSSDESEITDLFDLTPANGIEFTQAEENLNDFWNEETTTAAESVPVIEQDAAKALEESLFAAATSDIFGNIEDFNTPPSTNLDLGEEDLIFSSDTDDDLFADLAEFDSISSSDEDEQELSLQDISSFSQEPEALDLIPEFTQEPPKVAAVDSAPSADFGTDLFDSLDENPQILLEEIATTDTSTDIQLDNADSLFDDDDLLVSETEENTETATVEANSEHELDIFETYIQDELVELEDEENTVISAADANSDDELDISETYIQDELAELEDEENTVISAADANSDDELDISETYIQDELAELEDEENTVISAADANSDDELDISETYIQDELVELEGLEENTVISAADTNSDDEFDTSETYIQDELAELEAFLEEETTVSSEDSAREEADFADLEALLNTSAAHQEVRTSNDQLSDSPQYELTINQPASYTIGAAEIDDDFSDLERLLAEADQTISHSSPTKAKPQTSKSSRSSDRLTARFEETMKVPVKQLDDMSNLVGELVVNRNTLEQDHERLRQSLDNLLIQVQHLSDVGARMQELYERSLLEASLLASRKIRDPREVRDTNYNSDNSHTDMGFSELEMDRFTPFHTLSQEMIEFIVRVRESASDIDFVTEESERVARQFRQVTTQLQEGLTRARMVPFSQTIDRLRRGVRDNAIKYGKQVNLVIEGGDTLIDKMILDHLTDPLTHMLNNAIAHGIETPDIRKAAGKPPAGYITIRAFYQGNQTVISVGDDGAGIDPERIKVKAVQIGMITAAQAKSISRMEVYDLLFQPGFSIKDKADEISGRGVGMDVVRSEISEIRGIVNTDSTIGKGTTFTIRLPLTLSICKALCCVSDKARIAFPMDGVEDTLDIPVKSIQRHPDGQSYISWRDTLLPFRPLKELLTFNRLLSRGNVYGGNRDDDMVSVVVVRSGNTLIALQIDLVLSEQEIVIKQFESPAPKPIGVAGATVLGDGRIMPIADVLEIIEIFQGRISKHNGSKLWQQQQDPYVPEVTVEKIDPTVLIVDDSITVRELLSLTFNKAGYRVEQARDGQEAWDKLRSGLPCDIVFCDIEMPRCDGLELLSRIQKDPNLNHLPIAMLTSRGADKHRQMAVQLGASGYFTKPYLEEALLEAAVRMLSGEKLVTA